MKRIIALLTLTGLLCGCGQSAQTVEQTEPSVEVIVAAQTETGEPETEPATETVKQNILPPTEAAEPAFENRSGIREDGTFGSGALFIGDFLSYGLILGYLTDNDLLGEARYMVIPNAALPAFYYGPKLTRDSDSLYSPEFEGLLMRDAIVRAGEQTTAIYFMMGSNASEYATDEMMIQIVEELLMACPNATVYLQLVPYDRSTRVDCEEANRRVMATYVHYQQEDNPRVMLIDTRTAIGYSLTAEGFQLTAKGQACWYQALVAFAEGNDIPE